MEIRAYQTYNEGEILSLYTSVGWTAYTDHPEVLRKGFDHSLLTLAAYEGEQLLGIIRVVGRWLYHRLCAGSSGVSGASAERRRICVAESDSGSIQACPADRTGNGPYPENDCILQVHGVPGNV